MVKHLANLGITRSGKTYNAFLEVKETKVPSLYYNIKNQPVEVLNNSIRITNRNSIKQMIHALKNYEIVNFIPSESERERVLELQAISKMALEFNGRIDLIFDEAYEYIKQGTNESPIFRLARRGASEGVRIILLAQSGADIDKKALKQCEVIRVFRLNDWDYKYMRGIGFDGEKIKEMLSNAPAFSHVELSGGTMKLVKGA